MIVGTFANPKLSRPSFYNANVHICYKKKCEEYIMLCILLRPRTRKEQLGHPGTSQPEQFSSFVDKYVPF